MPAIIETYINRCTEAITLRNWAVALEYIERCIRLAPDEPRVTFLYGKLHLALGEPYKAKKAFEELLVLFPNSTVIMAALVDCKMAANEVTDAKVSMCKLVREHPNNEIALLCAATTYELVADFNTSRLYYEKLLSLEPSHDSKTLAAKALLRHGEWARGWRNYESRRHNGSVAYNSYGLPPWNGSNLKLEERSSRHRSILIIAEQGIGDCLQFLRYLRYLYDYFDTIVLVCHAEVQPLVKSSRNLFVFPLESLNEADSLLKVEIDNLTLNCWAPLMSLPHLLGRHQPTNPLFTLNILDLDLFDLSKFTFTSDIDRLKIGYCYAVNPLSETELRPQTKRAMSSEEMLTIVEIISKDLLSGQNRTGTCDVLQERLRAFKCKTNYSIEYVDLTFGINFKPKDYLETCQFLKKFDLIVSVDTSIVHACGVLGKPCIIVVPRSSDWRWGEASAVSAWYPSVRILRYPHAS